MSMYRQYEDPYALEEQLAELKEQYCTAVEEGVDDEVLINMQMEINELEERINFAWQDDEFDEDCRREEGVNW